MCLSHRSAALSLNSGDKNHIKRHLSLYITRDTPCSLETTENEKRDERDRRTKKNRTAPYSLSSPTALSHRKRERRRCTYAITTLLFVLSSDFIGAACKRGEKE